MSAAVDRKVLLVVLDGFGETPNPDPNPQGNAIYLAKTPNFDKLKQTQPYSLVEACGEAVGLVEGGMGGSEIGHFAIGAGRVVPQTLLQINWSIKDQSFFQNHAIKKAFDNVSQDQTKSKRLHFLGMISDAGVHAHVDHLYSLLEMVKKEGLAAENSVFLHLIGDGRDVVPQSILKFIQGIKEKVFELELEKVVRIASICGRFDAMDRDNNWERTRVAYDLFTQGKGKKLFSTEADEEKADLSTQVTKIQEEINKFYKSDAKETSDYYLPAIQVFSKGALQKDDSLIFFNYRTDRPRQLTQAFEDASFDKFPQTLKATDLVFTVFGPFNQLESTHCAFPVLKVVNNMGSWLSQKGIKQLRIAETEKFAHVTFFFNSQRDEPYETEKRVLIDSKKCQTFAEIPEMSAREITDAVIKNIDENEDAGICIVNYANADLVGHTGKLKPTIEAVEVLDECIGRLTEFVRAKGWVMLITGDHGNAEEMVYEDGGEKPSHSMNKVMCLLVNYKEEEFEKNEIKIIDGGLADIGPTCLEIMKVEQPKEMTGKSLLR